MKHIATIKKYRLIFRSFLFLGFFALGIHGINAQQETKNLQQRQDIFKLLKENRAPEILTGSGKNQHGISISLDRLRLAPKPQKNSVDTDALTESRNNGILHVIGSTIIDKLTVYYQSRFSKGLFIGLQNEERLNESNMFLQVNGAITIKELADPNRVDPAPVCTGSDGVIRLCPPPVVVPPPVVDPPPPDDNTPLSWNGNPYRQCENGKVIAYIGVVGNKGKTTQFERGWDGNWMNANIGTNGFKYEIPKYDNPDDKAPDTYCKAFHYRVPGLDMTDVWGCVNTMTRSECPDA